MPQTCTASGSATPTPSAQDVALSGSVFVHTIACDAGVVLEVGVVATSLTGGGEVVRVLTRTVGGGGVHVSGGGASVPWSVCSGPTGGEYVWGVGAPFGSSERLAFCCGRLAWLGLV